MSYIIELGENFVGQKSNCFSKRRVKIKPKQDDIYPKRMGTDGLINALGRYQESLIQHSRDGETILLRFLLNRIAGLTSLILQLRLNENTQQAHFNFRLLNYDNKYMIIETHERRKLICKNLCTHINVRLFYHYRIAVSPINGSINITAAIYSIQAPIGKTIQQYLNYLVKSITENIKHMHEPLGYIAQNSNEAPRFYNAQLQRKLSERRPTKIYQYFNFSNVFLNLASEATNQEQSLNQLLQKQADSFQKLRIHALPFGKEMNSLTLFQNISLQNIQKRQGNFQLNFMQREYINNRITLPSMQKARNPNQNCFVLNYIQVSKKLSEAVVKKINSGGFTSIYLCEIEYWYVGSYCIGIMPEAPQIRSTPPHKKLIIIKREQTKVIGGKCRIAHQRFILTHIKNGMSMFLPKYYLLAQKDSSFENDLLLDYIPYPNLSDHVLRSKQSLSMQTKIYLVYMITQGLRYLKDYRIAHLDLKPSNIMMHSKLTVKLIDFGQSYHPELKVHHRPGFSVPYSAPQNYNCPLTYSHKNDVFSLGVILYELLIGRYPFYSYSSRSRDECYRNQLLPQRTYLCPQQCQLQGEQVAFPALYQLLIRCLHADPESRPELEWIVLILRECLDYFY